MNSCTSELAKAKPVLVVNVARNGSLSRAVLDVEWKGGPADAGV